MEAKGATRARARAAHLSLATSSPPASDPGRVLEVPAPEAPAVELVAATLKCVSSGPHADDCACESRMPREVVLAAWERVQAEQHRAQSSFFYVRWQSDTWLSYGRADGTIGGVYCPAHAVGRARRAALERDDLPAPGLARVA